MGQRTAGRDHSTSFEQLEERVLFSVIAPAAPTVSVGYREAPDGATSRAHISWIDNNSSETGYRVEYSADGVTSWKSVGTDLPANSVNTTQVLDSGQKYFYRVRALDSSGPSAPSGATAANTPIDRVVQVSATSSANGTVTLNWPLDSDAMSYSVYRKARTDSTWTLLTVRPLPARTVSFTDPVAIGSAYEYQVVRPTHHYYGSLDGNAYGYVYAGNQFTGAESRGTALLVIDQTIASSISNDLATYQSDLLGDGWNVDEILVPRDIGDAHLALVVKSLIQVEAATEPGGIQSIVLIGHVPVPYSGSVAWDGHSEHVGAWPADSYYGDLLNSGWTDVTTTINTTYTDNNNIPGDGKFDEDTLPNPITIPVGRIDFANLPGMKWSFSPAATSDAQAEVMMIQRYLLKDHLWRTGAVSAASTAIEDDEFGTTQSENGWRNFAPLVGSANVSSQDWSANLNSAQSNLWSFGLGPGSETDATDVISGTQLHDATIRVNSVFDPLFGSFFGDWNKSSNLMREIIASAGTSLVSFWMGTPNWFLQTMGLGETIGQAAMLSQNNGASGPYAPTSVGMQAPMMEIMGDPTLTMSIVKPITALSVSKVGTTNILTWKAPTDTGVTGYYIYREAASDGSFVRLNANPLPAGGSNMQYSDSLGGKHGTYTYMVRAIKLQTTPSGSYYNFSEGAMITVQAFDGDLNSSTSRNAGLINSTRNDAVFFATMSDVSSRDFSSTLIGSDDPISLI